MVFEERIALKLVGEKMILKHYSVLLTDLFLGLRVEV